VTDDGLDDVVPAITLVIIERVPDRSRSAWHGEWYQPQKAQEAQNICALCAS